ncbi:kinase-like protein [Myriangium duriaei CBS 260.36]|uniref:Kinase-like protein n=1 Tax=Myriangium duriaei CBS 260.36 TaxID=1168546 RepID=A0A9P4MQ42_9PEZI|nr:kinase-like protein [Myriangium duriaei CBS 260.36]
MGDHETLACSMLSADPENGLEVIGLGCCCVVFAVDDDIVLKAPNIPTSPADDADQQRQFDYAINVLSSLNTFQEERAISAILESNPHPHIIRVIDVQHPEGVYLQKCYELPAKSSLDQRLAWYADMLSALVHLHDLNIAHADLHPKNLLLDGGGSAILCDFSTASSFGMPNFPDPDSCSPRNGFGNELCGDSDRFAAGSLIFWLERGEAPVFRCDSQQWHFDELSTGNSDLDFIVRRAWRGQYITTTMMLKDIIAMSPGRSPSLTLKKKSPSLSTLRGRIQQWRADRQRLYDHVLRPLPSPSELRRLEAVWEGGSSWHETS